MIYLGYLYLLIFILIGVSAVYDEVKTKDAIGIFLTGSALLIYSFATIAALFLSKPANPLPFQILFLAGIPILALEIRHGVLKLRKEDPTFTPNAAIAVIATVSVSFLPALVLGLLWTR